MPNNNKNQSQENAINHIDGPMLVIAGPGSGKTYVLTYRIKNLITNNIDPSKILVITFTRAAALEMQTRYKLLDNDNASKVVFGTFHSIFFNILKSDNSGKKYTLISDKEKIEYICNVLDSLSLSNLKSDIEEINTTLSLISGCKNNGNNPINYAQERFDSNLFESIFIEYNKLLSMFDKVDFDDMINKSLELINKNTSLRDYWQNRFQYILIDEFQDISKNQYELIKVLSIKHKNIFSVGDDDQSIYRFRGAKVELMKQFIEDFKDTKIEKLSINYRSTSNIVKFAGMVINENKNRFEKTIISNNISGDIVHIEKTKDSISEHKRVLDIINQFSINKTNTKIAILVRTNRQAIYWSKILELNHIKSNSVNRTDPFSTKYIVDIITYFKIANGDNSRSNFLRILNKPMRFINREALTNSIVTSNDVLHFYKNDNFMKIRINEMFCNIKRLSTMSPFLAVHYIRNTIGFDRYVKENETIDNFNMYKDDIELFTDFVKVCRSYDEVFEKLLMLKEQNNNKDNDDEGHVSIKTYHASKGLEYETVILPDLNEGVVPPKKCSTVEELEEERRMLYVAITRAKKNLYILFREDNNKMISSFIKNTISGNENII